MSTKILKVKLTNVGNPDFRQDPTKPVWGTKNKIITVKSLKEARDVCREYIEDNDLGSGNWTGGQVYEMNNKQIAHISYNGRIWEGEEDFNKPISEWKEIKI